MEWRVRHRQPKGTSTDGPSGTPPRRPSTRPPRTANLLGMDSHPFLFIHFALLNPSELDEALRMARSIKRDGSTCGQQWV